MRQVLLIAAGAGMLMCGGPAISAHHAPGAHYTLGEDHVVEGFVVQLVYRYPHSYVYVKAVEPNGRSRTWAIECAGPRHIGIQQTDQPLTPGDFIVVSGNPGRDRAAGRLLMKRIVRPSDGKRWSRLER